MEDIPISKNAKQEKNVKSANRTRTEFRTYLRLLGLFRSILQQVERVDEVHPAGGRPVGGVEPV